MIAHFTHNQFLPFQQNLTFIYSIVLSLEHPHITQLATIPPLWIICHILFNPSTFFFLLCQLDLDAYLSHVSFCWYFPERMFVMDHINLYFIQCNLYLFFFINVVLYRPFSKTFSDTLLICINVTNRMLLSIKLFLFSLPRWKTGKYFWCSVFVA